MQFAIEGTTRCQYGHVDVEGLYYTGFPLADTRRCGLEQDGMCGWVVSTHICTCISPEQAEAAYDVSAEWAVFVVFLVFGIVIGGMQLWAFSSDSMRSNFCEDLSSACNGFDYDKGAAFMYLAMLIILIGMPVGFLVGALVCLLRATRDATLPETWGYYQGCGHQNWFNPVNTGGKIFYSFMGLILLYIVVMIVWVCCIRPGRRSPRFRGRENDEFIMRVRQARDQVRNTTTISSTTSDSSGDAPPPRRVLRTQRSAQRLGELRSITLELANPVRLARSVSASRLDRGTRIAPTSIARRAAPIDAAVVHSGWMAKIVPSYIGPSQRRFFVLYDNGLFCFYDKEMDPPGAADCMGKVTLEKIESFTKIKEGRLGRSGGSCWTVKMVGKKIADWEVDAESEAAGVKWEEVLTAAIEKAKGGIELMESPA